MTYVRMTTYQTDPRKLEDGIRFAREQALAANRQQPGFQGARLLVDRRSGKTVAVTLWENEAAARAAESTLSQTRAQAAQLVGATHPITEIFEMVLNENA